MLLLKAIFIHSLNKHVLKFYHCLKKNLVRIGATKINKIIATFEKVIVYCGSSEHFTFHG